MDHTILVNKLHKLNISNSAISWFRDYLTGRVQCTKVNNVLSDPGDVTCGVPQGSILGPLMFILYMNDIKQVLTYCKISLYADDTVIWVSGTDVHEIEMKLQQDLLNVTDWLCANKLSVNVKKCKSLLVSSTGHQARNLALSVHINQEYLEAVDHYKYLGIFLDRTLNYAPHVDYLVKKA